MKNNHHLLLLLLAIVVSLGSCKKELNVYPTTSKVDGNIITDQQTAQTVLNGVYYQFANASDNSNGIAGTFWTKINEFIPSEFAGSVVYVFSNKPTYSKSLPDSTWSYGYRLVNAANGFIKNAAPVTSIPTAVKRQMVAKARFLRAFGNSELLLYFGQYYDPSSKYGIILRDTFVTNANLNLPRSGVATAYASILSDLDSAIAGLPVLNTSICYANASDAKLLKARMLMNRGAPGDYEQVINLTNDIISNGPFALEDSLKNIFQTLGFASREVILGIQPSSTETYKFDVYLGVNIVYAASASLVGLLANDARNQWVYQYAENPDPYTTGLINLMTKYYSGNPGSPVQTPLSTYCYAFRLSEAYLLEAEAITLSSGDLARAKTLLTTVMSHAGAGSSEMADIAKASTPETLQLEIVKENLRNFAYENGVDWLALRRLPFATLRKLSPLILNPDKLILPIPNTELAENNVFQNPGY